MNSTCEPLPFAGPNPLANALKTGTPADIPRVPEDAAAIGALTLDWYPCHMPTNAFHCWLVGEVAVLALRIEHNARIERRLRDRSALRAEKFWDDDRRSEAVQLGERLAQKPETVAAQLRRTPQGCDWLIGRWARLARIADVEKTWDDAQRSLAFDLLGTRPEDRTGPVGETIDAEGRLVATLDDLAALARREIASLLERKEEVAGTDALDRALAQADCVDEPSPEIRRLRRRDAELHRRMKWSIARLGETNPRRYFTPGVQEYFAPLAEALGKTLPDAPGPQVPAHEAQPEAEAEDTPEIEVEVEAAPVERPRLLSERQEARSKKAQSRREARDRKLERRRG